MYALRVERELISITMFLADRTIKALVKTGVLGIDPFDTKYLQPCSVDLTLGDVAVERHLTFDSTLWSIKSHQFLLASTLERVKLPANIAGTVSGKSTWGRKGLIIECAGHVDPGFEGDLTLEMFNFTDHDILMRKGTPICQIVFSYLDIAAEHPYQGRYQLQSGITAARASLILRKE